MSDGDAFRAKFKRRDRARGVRRSQAGVGATHGESRRTEVATRVVLFTDTLGDVNGVSRFIRNAADLALATSRELTVVTSTNFEVPRQRNIINVPPIVATKMPKYENLELVLPAAVKMFRAAAALRPTAIHISTPGSVGLVGRWVAWRLGVPMIGVYHTDFPAYIDKLFGNDSMTIGCESFMRWFYKPFARIFTRSDDYAKRLVALGIDRSRLVTLKPGIRIDEFHPRFRDETIYERLGCAPGSVRFVYCGRVSVEKNLPLLARVWPVVHERLRERGVRGELILIGDGPYRSEMETSLAGRDAKFLGFRYGSELAALYASADAFVFPSATDTLGQVVMESQASGLPVLVSDQGGPKEVVRHGETGLVLPAQDERAWIDAMTELATEHGRRRAMGLAAHRYLQDFSISKSFEHYWSVHESAVRAARV
ncbi:MAG TPA: glycosyltransferase family 1 protein [Phycisphaerales bacterium]|nr:glycosyltransferase family 1 protein [Phycisphaerales bacterium]